MPDPVTPNLSGLVSAGPAASASGSMPTPNAPPPPAETMTPAQAPPNVSTPQQINPAQAPPPPPPGANAGGHSKLLAMVTGLSVGLSAAGTSLGTHGKEGGAPEVQEFYQKQEQGKQQAAQAAQALKNQQLQNQLTTAQTNEANFRVRQMQGMFHDEQQQSHFKTQEAKIDTQAKAQDFFRQNGTAPEGWDVDPQTGQAFEKPSGPEGTAPSSGSPVSAVATPGAAAGAQPGAPTPAAGPSVYDRRQNMILDTAIAPKLGATDPDYLQAKKVLADPASTIFQKQQAMNSVQMKAGLQKEAVDDLMKKADLQSKQEANLANSSVAKLSTPEALVNPGAQAAIQAKIDDPTTDPKDVPRLRALIPQAAVAQLNATNNKVREARLQQIALSGDPAEAGKLLADRSMTLAELKTRFTKSQDVERAIEEAQKIDPTYKPAEADAQAKIAASAANAQFFGNTDSLLVKGGTLDQLTQAYAALGNGQIPVINKIDNLRKAAIGKGPLSAIYAAQLGVADDVSKVISGGTGSDQSRQQALDIIARDLSPEGQAAAINQIRQTVTSQRNGRIGTNPYMQDMYPDPSTRQETSGVPGTQKTAAPAPTTHIFDSAAYAAKHPGVDINAAIAKAKSQGYEVK
jgi:hypothetical protein